MGAAVLLLTVLCVWGMPMLLRASLQNHLGEARWLVLLLGSSLAVQVTASVYGGILTGCHRWDWHNGVYAVTYAVMLVGMILALKLGYGLVGLACVNLGSETLGRLVRLVLARRVCPEVEISRRHMSWGIAREMMGFGGKMFIYDCAYLLLTQTISLLLLTFLGPATLALFSRPVALIRTVKTLMLKYANVFVPAASSLQGMGDRAALCKLALDAARYGAFFALPPMLFLIIHGGSVLHLWMGGAYANGSLIALLVIAHFFGIAHAPLFSILAGLNQHGRAGLAIFCSAVASALATFIWLAFFDGGLLGVVVCLGVPWIAGNGLLLPWFAARHLGMSLENLLLSTWRQPLLYCLPYAAGLSAVRYCYHGTALHTLLWSGCAGGLVLLVCYWFLVFPESWRNKVLKRFLPLPAKAH
jgi:O-antigen/teichoic acid export membrane protein